MSNPFDKFKKTPPPVAATPPVAPPPATPTSPQDLPSAPVFGGDAPSAPAPATGAEAHSAGSINLSKGASINLTKRSGSKFVAVCEWPPATDYDVYALVLYTDGHTETVSTFGTDRRPQDYQLSSRDNLVRHLGDVRRSDSQSASETIEIELDASIKAVVPVVYSAQSNGTGSFRDYRVTMVIDNGAGAQVRVDAANANDNKKIYTCVPGIIVNGEGAAEVRALEQYSKPGSENRPVLNQDLTVTMDAGDRNAYK